MLLTNIAGGNMRKMLGSMLCLVLLGLSLLLLLPSHLSQPPQSEERMIKLYRVFQSEAGTRGCLVLPSGKAWHTLELPWLFNERNVSCIPEGDYEFFRRGEKWQAEEVPGRSGIQIHVGNNLADTTGCILVGGGISVISDKFFLWESKLALREFNKELKGNEKINIVIVDAFKLGVRC